MDVQIILFNGLKDLLVLLCSTLTGFLVAYVRQHFSAKQISTGSLIASEAVNFVAQTAKNLGITEDSAKFQSAKDKAKELASKVGIKFTDSQWQTLLESALKTAKDAAEPIKTITSTTTPLSEDDIVKMIQDEIKKVTPNLPVDQITSIVKPMIDAELSKLSVQVNVGNQGEVAPTQSAQ